MSSHPSILTGVSLLLLALVVVGVASAAIPYGVQGLKGKDLTELQKRHYLFSVVAGAVGLAVGLAVFGLTVTTFVHIH